MKRLILSLGILITAVLSFQAKAQSPCVNDLTAPTVTWNGSEVGKTSANPLIIKLNAQGYAAIVADSGNGQAGVNKAKVFVPSQFTSPAGSSFTVVDAQDDCADTYTGSLASKWPKFTLSKGAFVCNDVNSTSVTPMAVTYNVFDASNNVSTGTIYVKVIEAVKPTITTKPATLTLSATGSATLTASDVVLSKSDNCGVPTVTLSKTSFGCSDLGSNNVYVKVTDATGNKDSAIAVVTVVDATAPSVVLNNASLYLDANGSLTVTTADVVTSYSDVCDVAPVVVITPNTFDCSDLGAQTVTVTVTDASGNQFSGTSTVTVGDNLAPVVTTQGLTVYLDATGNVSISGSDVVVSGSDNCDVPTYTVVPSSFTCSDAGANTVAFKATDASGNEYTTNVTVTVVDNLDPSLTTTNVTLVLNANGSATLTEADAVVSKGDNCGTPTITLSQTAFDCTDVGTVSVDVTATDGSSNTTVSTITVTVQDNADPVIDLLAGPYSFSLGTDGTLAIDEQDLTDDITDNCGIASVVVSPNSFDCTDKGSNTVTITATDDNGNVTVETVTITIVDDLDPLLSTQDATISVDVNGSATVTEADVVVSATDNCDTPTITISPSTFTCSDAGSVQVDVTATDAAGNATTNTVTVTIEDTFAPTLVKTVYDRNLRNGFAVLSVEDVLNEIAQDNCAIDYSTSALSREFFDCEDVGVNTVTASIFDMAGNFAYVNFSVIIHDTILPVANALSTYTVQLDANGSAGVSAEDVDNGSSDNCNNFTLSLSQTSFTCDDLGSNTVTFTIEDEEGNTATASVTIVVEDNIDPVWNFTSNGAQSCELLGEDYTALSEVRVYDGLGTIIPILAIDQSSDYGDGCSFTVPSALADNDYATGVSTDYELGAYIAFDLGSVQQLGSVDIAALNGDCSWGPSYTDNQSLYYSVDGVNYSYAFDIVGTSDAALTSFNFASPVSARYLKFSVNTSGGSPVNGVCAVVTEDYIGLSELQVLAGSSVVFDTIAYSSTWAPSTLQCIPAQTIASLTDGDQFTGAGTESDFGAYIIVGWNTPVDVTEIKAMPITDCTWDEDDFDGDQVSVSADGNTWYWVGTLQNSLNGTFTSLVDTMTLPVRFVKVWAGNVSLPLNSASVNNEPEVTLYLDANGSATLDATAVYGSYASDNCDVTISADLTSFDCSNIGDVSVVLTATDDAGNSSNYTVTVSVLDTLAPAIDIASSYTVYLDANGAASLEFADIDNGTSDNCTDFADLIISLSQTSFDCGLNPTVAPGGQPNLVTVTVTDASNNTSTASLTVTVKDTLAPTLAFAGANQIATVYLDENGEASVDTAAIVNDLLTVTDNCGVTGTKLSVSSNSTFNCGNVNANPTIWIVALDEAGNKDSISVELNILDTIRPNFISSSELVFSFNDTRCEPNFCDYDLTPDNIIPADGVIGQFNAVAGQVYDVTLIDSYGDGWGYEGDWDVDVYVEKQVGASWVVVETYAASDIADQFASEGGGWCVTSRNFTSSTNEVIRFRMDAFGPYPEEAGVVVTTSATVPPVALPQVAPAFNNGYYKVSYNASTKALISAPQSFTKVRVDFTNGSGFGQMGTAKNAVGIDQYVPFEVVSISPASGRVPVYAYNGGADTVYMQYTGAITGGYSTISPLDSCLGLRKSGNSFLHRATGVASALYEFTSPVNNLTLGDYHLGGTTVIKVYVNTGGFTVSEPAGYPNTSCSWNSEGTYTFVDSTISGPVAPTSLARTVYLDANGEANLSACSFYGNANDNCDVSLSLSDDYFTCADLGQQVSVLTATDPSGNTRSINVDVTVLDTIVPTALVVNSYTAVLNATGSASLTFSTIDSGSFDNCSYQVYFDESIDEDQNGVVDFDCAQIGTVNVFGVLVDPSENSTPFSVLVNVVDQTAPVFDTEFNTIQDTVYAVQYDCFGLVQVDLEGLPLATDNCDVNVDVIAKWNGSTTTGGTIPMPVGNHIVWAIATDNEGNKDSVEYQNIWVIDTTLPDATFWNNVTVVLGANGTAAITPAMIVDASYDNCGIENVTIFPNQVDCDDLGGGLITGMGGTGYVTLTVTMTDFNGNARTYYPMVAVVDQSAPVFTPLAGSASVALNASGVASIVAGDLVQSITDNCGVENVSLSQSSFDCSDLGVNTIVLTAEDASGNVSTYTVALNVVDNIAPTYVTKNISVALNAGGNATVAYGDLIDGSVTDNCSSVFTYSVSKTYFDCSNVGLNTVSVTVTDESGNQKSLSATVTVVDNTNPTLTLANSSVTLALNASGVASLGTSEIVGLVSDNCGIQSVVLSKTSFNCSDLGSGTVLVTATDVNGNTATATQNIVVVDLIAPVVTVKSTATVKNLDATGNAVIAFADILNTVVDNCSVSPTVTWSPTSVSCAQVGPVTVSIIATDASGNVTTTTKLIQVVDEIAPALVTKSYTAVLNSNGNATIVEANVVQSKSDNCGVPSVTLSKSVFDCTNKGANTVTVTATDVNGNVTSSTAVVTVVDQTAPFFTMAPSLSVMLNASGVASISVPSVVSSAGDNCDIPTVTLSKYTFTCADMPSTTITVTATDASSNTTTATFTVNVLDQIAPVVTPKSTPTTIALDATGNAAVTLADVMGTAVDNCTASPVVTWFPTTVTCAQVGPVTVTITAADASGNVSNATKVIQVIDAIAPTVVLNGNSLVTYTLPLNASGNATLTVGNVVASATDNCGTPVVSLSKSSFDCSNLGDNVVVVTAVDQYGNVKTSNAIVKVVDVTAPSIVTPSTQVVLNLGSNGVGTLSLNQVMLSSVDNCGIPTVTYSPSSFSCANLGNNTVTITSTDASGNTTTATVVVLVQDVTAPIIATVSGSVTKALGSNGTAVISQADVVSSVSDACDNSVTVTWTPTSVSCANVGNVAVVITAVDASGNVSTSVKSVLVVDQLAPVVTAPASITLNLNAAGTATLPAGVASATDNCAVNSIQYSKSLFDCSNLGTNAVTVTATDVHGNVSTANMNVVIVDNTAPSLSLVASPVTVSLNAAGTATVNAAMLVANANDNCSVASYTVTPNTFSCSALGANTVTVTATDGSGNSTAQTVTVNVVDVTGPSIVVNPAAVTVALNASGVGSISNAQVVSTVTDNCTATPSVVVTPNVFTCNDLGQQMVTIFATDAAGNITTTTKLITVVDASAPVIVSAPQNVTLPGCNGTFTYAYQVTDNCGYTATLVSGMASGTQFPVGTTTVTWSFSDASGNTTTHSFNVTVLPLGTYTLPVVNEYCAGHGHFDLSNGQAGLVFYGSSVYNNGTTFYTEVPGTYALNYVFTDANGCTQNGVFNLIVRPRPAKPVVNQIAATTLESSVTGATYQWYRNEQLIVGAKSRQYVFTQGGKYEVVVFNAYGCGTMSEGFVVSSNGLSVEEVITSVRLFPNPTSSAVTLETSFEAAEDFRVTLVDMMGSVVYRGTLSKGSNKHVIDLSTFAAGTYNVILTDAAGVSSSVQRVVKID